MTPCHFQSTSFLVQFAASLRTKANKLHKLERKKKEGGKNSVDNNIKIKNNSRPTSLVLIN
jgi:hypothetical protein